MGLPTKTYVGGKLTFVVPPPDATTTLPTNVTLVPPEFNFTKKPAPTGTVKLGVQTLGLPPLLEAVNEVPFQTWTIDLFGKELSKLFKSFVPLSKGLFSRT